VREIDGVFIAIDIDGVVVGTFGSLREAAAALDRISKDEQ
jgi:hypothetical protein